MRLVRQPKGSNVCGLACVAMVAGVDLEGGIDLVGHRGKTWGTDIRIALDKAGILHGSSMISGWPKGDAMLSYKEIGGRRRHWVLWYKEKYYDPLSGIHRKQPDWLSVARVTSHLPLFLFDS